MAIEDERALAKARLKFFIQQALAVTCPECQALTDELCRMPDGQLLEYEGSRFLHLPRLRAVRIGQA